MACEEWEDRILQLAMGELPDREAARVRGHLQTCAACSRRFEAYSRLLGQLEHLEVPAGPPEGLHEAVLERVLPYAASYRQRRRERAAQRAWGWFLGALGAMTALVFATALWTWAGRIAVFAAARFVRDFGTLWETLRGMWEVVQPALGVLGGLGWTLAKALWVWIRCVLGAGEFMVPLLGAYALLLVLAAWALRGWRLVGRKGATK